MGYPVIIIDSNAGGASDTACSGAGPNDGTTSGSTLTGAAGVTANDGSANTGRRVNLDGSPDLTNVATDSTHVLYFHDTTSGHRRTAVITGKGNSGTGTAYVDVGKTLGGASLGAANGVTKSWAIGGKKATLFGADSFVMLNDGGGFNGDAQPGWIFEFQSGHTETVAGVCRTGIDGDTTNGALTIRGKSGAATKPIITFSNDDKGIFFVGALWRCLDFELRNTNGSKTASVALWSPAYVRGMTISHATNYFWKAIYTGYAVMLESEIGYCASHGIELIGGAGGYGTLVAGNYVHNCGDAGIYVCSSGLGNFVVHSNICKSNSGDGIRVGLDFGSNRGSSTVMFNTCYGNGRDGIRIDTTTGEVGYWLSCFNNICSSNTGYGLNYLSVTLDKIQRIYAAQIFYNNTYNNTAGAASPTGLSLNDPGLDPQFTDAANGDFTIGTNLKAAGYPFANFPGLSKRSYTDIGALQRQEAGGTTGRVPGWQTVRGVARRR